MLEDSRAVLNRFIKIREMRRVNASSGPRHDPGAAGSVVWLLAEASAPRRTAILPARTVPILRNRVVADPEGTVTFQRNRFKFKIEWEARIPLVHTAAWFLKRDDP